MLLNFSKIDEWKESSKKQKIHMKIKRKLSENKILRIKKKESKKERKRQTDRQRYK